MPKKYTKIIETPKNISIKFPEFHINQQVIHDDKTRFRVLCCGRRFGKSRLDEIDAVECAAAGGVVWYCAPSYSIVFQEWEKICAMAAPLIKIRRQMEKYVTLIGGGTIYFHTTNSGENLRGSGVNLMILDEAAFIDPIFWPRIARPMLADRTGRALFTSTPNGINWFSDLYYQGLDKVNFPEWQSFRFKTIDNPYINPKEIEEIRRTTSDLDFRQEYEAEILDMTGAIFKNIKEVCVLQPNRVVQDGHIYVAGIDWGGGGDDFGVISVFDSSVREMVYYERINKTDFETQRNMMKSVWEYYKPAFTIAETNAMGRANIEALRHEGIFIIEFTTSQATKHALVQEFLHNIETRRIKLLDDNVLKSEMTAYTCKRSINGGYSYSASRGHDDIIMATMLANHLLGQSNTVVADVKSPALAVHRNGIAVGGMRNSNINHKINFTGFEPVSTQWQKVLKNR